MLSAEYGLPIEEIDRIIDLTFKQMREIIEKTDIHDKSQIKCFMIPILGKFYISERKKDTLATLRK